jgi:hypothetical protein
MSFAATFEQTSAAPRTLSLRSAEHLRRANDAVRAEYDASACYAIV